MVRIRILIVLCGIGRVLAAGSTGPTRVGGAGGEGSAVASPHRAGVPSLWQRADVWKSECQDVPTTKPVED